MKKLLLVALGAMMSVSLFAQEEDVTHYIQNAGFDEDLTFQSDGSMKEAVSTETSLSERSWAYIAADSSVYAKPKSTSSQQRKDGRSKLDATNGFIGRVQGWTIETNKEFPSCEWVYFGTIPYNLGADAIPIAGLADDLGVLVFVLKKVWTDVDPEIQVKARQRLSKWFDEDEIEEINELFNKE